jgi:hypothetical protein
MKKQKPLSENLLYMFMNEVSEYVHDQAPCKPASEFFESNEVPLRNLAKKFLGRKPCAYNVDTLVEDFMLHYGRRWGVKEGGAQ